MMLVALASSARKATGAIARPIWLQQTGAAERALSTARLNGGAAGQPTCEPGFQEQYRQRRHNQPAPQLMLIFQFCVMEPALLLVLPGQLDLRRLERHTEPH